MRVAPAERQSARSTAATPPACTDVVVSPAASRTSCGPCSIATARPPLLERPAEHADVVAAVADHEHVGGIDAEPLRARARAPVLLSTPCGAMSSHAVQPTAYETWFSPMRSTRSTKSCSSCRRARRRRCGRPGCADELLERHAVRRAEVPVVEVLGVEARARRAARPGTCASGRCSRSSVSTSRRRRTSRCGSARTQRVGVEAPQDDGAVRAHDELGRDLQRLRGCRGCPPSCDRSRSSPRAPRGARARRPRRRRG